MPDQERYESQDLEDFQPLDGSDSLEADPGDDPLDRGVATPEHWSAGMRYGTTADEQYSGESLDQMLAEEEPDESEDDDDELPEDYAEDFDAEEEDYSGGILVDDGPEPRAGRLVAEDEGAHPVREDELYATSLGNDGDAESAEESAVHLVTGEDG
jgi:hypothetical protein